jgi:uncharacterized protein YbaR (Trm112 family)
MKPNLTPQLLELLRCPETHQRLRLANAEELAALNQRVDAGTLVNHAGVARKPHLEAALLREDGRVAYPVDQDIPCLLIEESFLLER